MELRYGGIKDAEDKHGGPNKLKKSLEDLQHKTLHLLFLNWRYCSL